MSHLLRCPVCGHDRFDTGLLNPPVPDRGCPECRLHGPVEAARLHDFCPALDSVDLTWARATQRCCNCQAHLEPERVLNVTATGEVAVLCRACGEELRADMPTFGTYLTIVEPGPQQTVLDLDCCDETPLVAY